MNIENSPSHYNPQPTPELPKLIKPLELPMPLKTPVTVITKEKK